MEDRADPSTPQNKMRRLFFDSPDVAQDNATTSAAKTSHVVQSRLRIFPSVYRNDNEHAQNAGGFPFAMPASVSFSPKKGAAAALADTIPLMGDPVPVPKIAEIVQVSQSGGVNSLCMGFFHGPSIAAAYHKGIGFPLCIRPKLKNVPKKPNNGKEAMHELGKLMAEAEASGHVRLTQQGEAEEYESV